MRESVRAEVERQIAIMADGCVDFFGRDELAERLAQRLEAGLPLRVKLGMDPSSPDLHLGHTVVLQKLRRFLELGHAPIFLIGDFTARIGDPSGRKKTRPALSEQAVRDNAATYVEQVSKILDVERVEIRFNSEWMDRMTPADFVRLCATYTVARLLERDDFAKRHAAGLPIFVHEFLYPFVQGYDSVALDADVELGGTDQTFNLLMGREIQKSYGKPLQAVITHPLLVGTDGVEKMSKSLGNSIGITDSPSDMYGKLMSIPDTTMPDFFDLLSSGEWDGDRERFDSVRGGRGDPMAAKHRLAELVVARIHGAEHARAARANFERVVQRKGVPEDVPQYDVALAGRSTIALLDALDLHGLIKSRSEARRLIDQGAVSLDGERVDDATLQIGPGAHLVRLGRRRFARLRVAG